MVFSSNLCRSCHLDSQCVKIVFRFSESTWVCIVFVNSFSAPPPSLLGFTKKILTSITKLQLFLVSIAPWREKPQKRSFFPRFLSFPAELRGTDPKMQGWIGSIFLQLNLETWLVRFVRKTRLSRITDDTGSPRFSVSFSRDFLGDFPAFLLFFFFFYHFCRVRKPK